MEQPQGEADPRGVEPLLKLLQDEDADVRYYAVTAFADDYPALNGDNIRAALAARGDDPDEQVRDVARRALAERRCH
jgi:HEAT repeat protein